MHRSFVGLFFFYLPVKWISHQLKSILLVKEVNKKNNIFVHERVNKINNIFVHERVNKKKKKQYFDIDIKKKLYLPMKGLKKKK